MLLAKQMLTKEMDLLNMIKRLVLVTGAGAEARNSIGIILVAGMVIGTLFTLIILPLLYELLAKDHSRELMEIESGTEPLVEGKLAVV